MHLGYEKRLMQSTISPRRVFWIGMSISISVFLLMNTMKSSADSGIIVPRPELKGVDEHLQSAIIAWDGEVEKMILSVTISESYNSESEDTSTINYTSNNAIRVIPFPSKPNVKQVDIGIFQNAQDVINDYIDSLWQFSGIGNTEEDAAGMGGSLGGSGKSHLEIVFTEQLGYHNLVCIKIETPEAFVKFTAEKLEIGEGEFNSSYKDHMKNIITSYLARGIRYFVFDTVEIPSDPSTIRPLMYTFNSSSLYYPMQISNLASYIGGINLLLLTKKAVDISPANEYDLDEDIGGYIDISNVDRISSEIADMFTGRVAFSYLQNDEARWDRYRDRDYHYRDHRDHDVFLTRYDGDLLIHRYDESFDPDEFEDWKPITSLFFLAIYILLIGIVVIEWYKGPQIRLGKEIDSKSYVKIVRRSVFRKRVISYFRLFSLLGIFMILLPLIIFIKMTSSVSDDHPFFSNQYPFFFVTMVGILSIVLGLICALSHKISFNRGNRFAAIFGICLPMPLFIVFNYSLTAYRDNGSWNLDLYNSYPGLLAMLIVTSALFVGWNVVAVPFQKWINKVLVWGTVLSILLIIFLVGMGAVCLLCIFPLTSYIVFIAILLNIGWKSEAISEDS